MLYPRGYTFHDITRISCWWWNNSLTLQHHNLAAILVTEPFWQNGTGVLLEKPVQYLAPYLPELFVPSKKMCRIHRNMQTHPEIVRCISLGIFELIEKLTLIYRENQTRIYRTAMNRLRNAGTGIHLTVGYYGKN
jgi:hypothetical protein